MDALTPPPPERGDAFIALGESEKPTNQKRPLLDGSILSWEKDEDPHPFLRCDQVCMGFAPYMRNKYLEYIHALFCSMPPPTKDGASEVR